MLPAPALMMLKRLNSMLMTVSPEQPPLPGCQLEREPEEEQSTEKEKNLEEENNNMKLTLKETEIESLKAQIDTLIKKSLTPELLESSKIPKMLEYSTGFTYEYFNQLCTIFGIPNDPHTAQVKIPLTYKRNEWEVAEMPLRSQLLFVSVDMSYGWCYRNKDFWILYDEDYFSLFLIT
ncbi:hypothetical protein ATANTOWER_022910 [Ataeniobius toweri]|uniref:Uncharacterized protein n=1 Tax=Ataeniobius toweri TaxID=208326 RepID=A0ABU7BH68_9TELE|nr:hypothetical protein [Ataeniobius toweri]